MTPPGSVPLAEAMSVDAHRRCRREREKQGRDRIGAVAGCEKQAGDKTGGGDCGAEQAIHGISGLGCNEDGLVYL